MMGIGNWEGEKSFPAPFLSLSCPVVFWFSRTGSEVK